MVSSWIGVALLHISRAARHSVVFVEHSVPAVARRSLLYENLAYFGLPELDVALVARQSRLHDEVCCTRAYKLDGQPGLRQSNSRDEPV